MTLAKDVLGFTDNVVASDDSQSKVTRGLDSSNDELRREIIQMSHAQSSLMEGSATSAQRLNESSNANVEAAKEAKTLAGNALDQEQQGERIRAALRTRIESLESTTESLDQVVEIVAAIGQRSEAIAKVASQSRLIALNASIEAARLGAQGKAFAVVAESVKDLADSNTKVAAEIQSIVSRGTRSILKVLEETKTGVKASVEHVDTFEESMVSISGQIRKIFGHAETIVSTAEQQQRDAATLSRQLRTGSEDHAATVSRLIGLLTGSVIEDLTPKQAVDESFDIIDVRGLDEFRGDLGHIQRAQLITLNERFEEHLRPLDRERSYLFVCRRGGRSARACRIAQKLGFKNIYNLAGGMLAWAEEQLPVVGREAA